MTAIIALLLAVGGCLHVEGDRITMGDLATAVPAFLGLDAAEPVGFAPAPGVQRRFSAAELDRLAARKGVVIHAEPVCFEREMETLTRERVLAALRESAPEGAQLELVDFSKTRIPKGVLEFPRSALAAARPGTSREPVIWRGRVKYTDRLSVSVWAKARVGSANGSVADVSRGDTVRVEAHSGAASLQFEARAESAGRAGDVIPIRNMQSGKTFRARVVRKGSVAVD